MSESSPLDTLKDLVLRVDSLLDRAADERAGACHPTVDDDDPVYEALDRARQFLADAIAEHVRGVTWTGICAEYTPSARTGIETYDDGSQVVERFRTAGGNMVASYFPRHDGDRGAFVDRFVTSAVIYEAEFIAFEAANPAVGS